MMESKYKGVKYKSPQSNDSSDHLWRSYTTDGYWDLCGSRFPTPFPPVGCHAMLSGQNITEADGRGLLKLILVRHRGHVNNVAVENCLVFIVVSKPVKSKKKKFKKLQKKYLLGGIQCIQTLTKSVLFIMRDCVHFVKHLKKHAQLSMMVRIFFATHDFSLLGFRYICVQI